MATVLESSYLIQLGGDASTLSLSRQQVLTCARLADSPYWSGRCSGGDISEVRRREKGLDMQDGTSERWMCA